MIYIYRLTYIILKTLLIIFSPIWPVKIRSWLNLRTQKIQKTQNFNKTFWFHASSGEIEYCKSVIRLLKEQQPHSQIVVTYSSPSAEKLFDNIKPYVNQFLPICWDTPKLINELIDYIQPQILVFSRTDLWPELITQIHKRHIKLGVISYNPSFGIMSDLVIQRLLKNMNFISVLDQNIKIKLENIGIFKNIFVDGDTRFDQVFYRLSQKPKLKIHSSHKIFVCGSTWPEDETVLLPCFRELLAKNIKIILCPHEVDANSILRLKRELDRLQYSYKFLSSESDFFNISLNKDIFIIDTVGYLADVYRDADVAFVGGSYKEKIHSVMEPLCCGLPVITGPFYQNSPEAIKYQKSYVFNTSAPEDISKNVLKLLTASKNDLLAEMKTNLNSSQKVLDHMRQQT